MIFSFSSYWTISHIRTIIQKKLSFSFLLSIISPHYCDHRCMILRPLWLQAWNLSDLNRLIVSRTFTSSAPVGYSMIIKSIECSCWLDGMFRTAWLTQSCCFGYSWRQREHIARKEKAYLAVEFLSIAFRHEI